MLLFILVVLYYCWTFVHQACESNEASDAMTGLLNRWIIKSFVLIGLFLALLAGLSTLLRQIVYLFGPEELRPEVKMNMLTTAEAEHLQKHAEGDAATDIATLEGQYDHSDIVRGG